MRTVPLKRIVGINLRTLPETTEPGFEFRYVDIGAVSRGQFMSEPQATVFADAPSRARRLVRQGDTIISTVRTYLRAVCPVQDSATDLVVSTGFAVLTPSPSIDPRYLGWLAQSDVVVEEVVARSVGVSYPAINPSDIGDVQVPQLPLARQRSIADYLDRETARIDALIEKKRRLIELVGERRRVFVSKAVTIGVYEHVSLAETDNQFAPEIPSEWSLERLRHLVIRIIDTAHKTAPVIEGGNCLVVRTSNVKEGRLVLDDARYTDEASWREWTTRGRPRPGDVMFTREAPAGEACLVPGDLQLCIGQRVVLLQVDRSRISGEWLMHSIYSGPAQRFVEVLSKATTVAHLNMSDIPDIPVAVPPVEDQQHILEKVRRHVDECERLAGQLLRQIDLLVEHRQALITVAVTGDLEVPGVAA